MGRYESAIVRIVGQAAGRPTAGVGVLVGSREVVTCAHVVNAALGRNHREQSQPATSDLVQLEFPMLPGPPVRTAAVAADAWRPPPQSGASGGDVAGLLLNEEAPAAAARAKFSRATQAPGTRLRVYGYPDTPPREAGAWVDVDFKGEVGGNLIQVESRQDQTIKAQPGYSGSPVWLDHDGVVVGLLHATAFADEPYRDAYLLPAQMVAKAWESQFDYLLVPQNPYRGLETFTVDDSALFFGRDTEIDALTARVTNQQLVMVVGPSGVGKSSLIQAGLIPRLKSEGRWSIAIVRPEKDPWHRLAASLLRSQRDTDPMVPAEQSRTDIELEIERLHREGLGPTGQYLRSIGRPLLLVVDQFEELLASSVTPDVELLELLLPPAGAPDDAIRLVHTVRADFLPLLLTVPGIGARLDQRVYFLSPLTGDQVRDAIERPAQARGAHFQDGLVDLIMREAAEGSLPLLEFTLTRMWQTQRQKTLDFTGYNNLGGLHGALDRFADEQVAKLADVTAAVIDRVLLRLVRTAPGDIELVTRQRVHQTGIPDTEWQALQQLAATRLVIVDNDPLGGSYAELAHEALITSWQHLYKLVQDNNDFLRWLAAIAGRAAEKDPLPEARIDDARRWLETRPEEIPESVKAFIKDSRTAAEGRLRELSEARNRAEEARQQAEAAREAAEISARRAEALHLAANAELAFNRGSITIALALGVESFLTEPTLRGDLLLRRVLRMYARTRARLDHDDAVRAVAFAADGTQVATGSMDGSARVFDAATSAERARLDHDDGVRAVAFSPDGTQVATGSMDGSARVFDAATSAELARLDHDDEVRAVAFSPDGTQVATGSIDGSARVFDAATSAELARLDHDDEVWAAAFSPDGTQVATGSMDGSARVFDAATSAERARLDHDDEVWAVAFSPDGTQVATGSSDGSARVFDAVTGVELARLDHDGAVLAVAFSPDETRVATGSNDGSARVFDAATGVELARLDHGGEVRAVAFSPDGSRVATGGIDGSARVFDAATGVELARLDHDGPVMAVAFSADGTRVATGSNDGSARVFDAAAGAERARLDHHHRVRTLAFSPDGSRVATGSIDRSARVFAAATGDQLARLNHDRGVWAVAFAPDGTRVATGSMDGSARVFDAATGDQRARLDHDGPVMAVAFSADGTRVATGSIDRSARVFDAATGDQLARLDHDRGVWAVAFAPDGTRVATGSIDSSARVFDAATSAERARLDHDDAVWAVAFSPDGSRVATGSSDGSARVFDAATGAELAPLDHDGEVLTVAFSPDGSRVATGSSDSSARVFDAATGAELARLDHDGEVMAVAFSPDGSRVATGSSDSSARVFDAATGAELARLDHDGAVLAVAFSPDGSRVATGSIDSSARLFEVEPALLLARAIVTMSRPLNASELRRYSLTENSRHIQHWYRSHKASGY